MRTSKILFTASIAAVVAVLVPLLSFAATGVIDATNKYAWGSNIGWVNFNPTNGNVQVSDSGLAGYAWSENYGWINLAPSQSGVKNNGTGVLSGYAWGEGTGYINFSGVTINSQGVFTGSATGDIVGSLTFDCTNCKVVTTWQQASGVVPVPPTVAVGAGGVPYIPGVGPIATPTTTVIASTTETQSSTAPSTSTPSSTLSLTDQLKLLQAKLVTLEAALNNKTVPSMLQFVFSRNLGLWNRGIDVTALQKVLIAQSSGPAAMKLKVHGVTQTFGILTFNALREFQKKAGIRPATGYFGPATRAYMNNLNP